MSSRSLEKSLYFEWLNTSKEERSKRGLPFNAKNMAKKLEVDYATVKRWNFEFKTFDLASKKVTSLDKRVAADKLGEGLDKNIIDDPEKMKRDAITKMYEKVMEKSDSAAFERLAKVMGWIVEKVDHKIIMDGGTIARAIFAFEREREDNGVAKVPKGHKISSPELHEDTGQGKDEDNPV